MQLKQELTTPQRWVPVVSSTGKPLMPCHPARARKLIKANKAIKRFYRGFFYIKLIHRSDGDVQTVAVGIDPGSKREGFTVMSAKRTFVNIQLHARDGKAIQKALEARANARKARRYRKTPYRKCRPNRARREGWVPPSTKARWQLKLNLVKALSKLYPISIVAVEDIRAITKKGSRKWNSSFSPVQTGKNWFYSNLELLGYKVIKFLGLETASLRQSINLNKTSNKLATVFSAHCVDSWVMANRVTGNRQTVDLTDLVEIRSLTFSRRQLHYFNSSKGGKRIRYGGTMSLGYKKGTLVIHPKYGKCLIGGNNGKDRLSLHSLLTGSRLCQNAKPEDLIKISYSPWVVIDRATFNKEEKCIARKHRLCTKLFNLGIIPRMFQQLKNRQKLLSGLKAEVFVLG